MARNPNKINGLDDHQITAYQKSFLQNLDSSNEKLTDWEAEFVESAMGRFGHYTPRQANVIENLMDKYPKIMPTFKHYSDPQTAYQYVLFGGNQVFQNEC